ncbi:hypothetical protein COD03_21990 [Bacillus cereus]|nr:hypothetical protein COD03_21990 [Bacillus cereus]PGX11199.1 hypothetical protein COE00_15510 [Bacillus cereus]
MLFRSQERLRIDTYISFDDDGVVLLSTNLDDNSRLVLNIKNKMKILMNESQKWYMKWYQENLFRI